MGLLIAAALGGGFLLLLGVIATRPATFKIERTAQVGAAPEVVFPLLDDLHAWTRWSPWEKLDPAMRKTFAGPPRGPGASYAWDGNKKAGAGKMRVVDSAAPRFVTIEIGFLRPFPALNDTTFTLTARGDGTEVRWEMTGKNTFATKAFQLFVNMDKLVGRDFEEGLANLDRVARGG